MRRFLLAFALCLAATSASLAIIGGKGADDSDARHHTVMVTSRVQDCSGTVIARDLIITTAHCVAGSERYVVPAGGAQIAVAQVMLHPGFKADAYQKRRPTPDLAILKLSSPLPANFRAARLATEKVFPPHGARYLVAGFGSGIEGDRRTFGTLRITELVNTGSTGNVMIRLVPPKNAVPAGSCDGDSGGSAFRLEGNTLVLHGVIAWADGPGTKNCGAVTGVVLIGFQLDWIRATAKRLGTVFE